MKTIKIIFLVSVLIPFGAMVLKAAANDEGTVTKSFNVNKGGMLTMDINPGTIRISTWSKDMVEVKINGLDQDQIDKVDFSSDKNNVSIRYEEGWSSDGDLDFEVTVPSRYNLDLKTTAGDIKILNDIDGDVMVATNGGDLSFRNISGRLKAESSGGDISVLGNVDGDLDVNTMGGNIKIGSIKGKSARINTMGGEITISDCSSGVAAKTYGGDISVGNAGGNSKFETYGGNITVGKVTGNVSMETYGGNLDLKGASGKVKARTNGGNVTLYNVVGSVDAKTLAGEVMVELNPSPNSESSISTNAGSIELRIPPSAKTTIEARVRVQGWWKNAEENYKINSDFEAESYNANDRRHEITGTYVLNSGGSKIYLKSVNDEISIKKTLK